MKLTEQMSDFLLGQLMLGNSPYSVGETLSERAGSSADLRKSFPALLIDTNVESADNLRFMSACQAWMERLTAKHGWNLETARVQDVTPFARAVFTMLRHVAVAKQRAES